MHIFHVISSLTIVFIHCIYLFIFIVYTIWIMIFLTKTHIYISLLDAESWKFFLFFVLLTWSHVYFVSSCKRQAHNSFSYEITKWKKEKKTNFFISQCIDKTELWVYFSHFGVAVCTDRNSFIIHYAWKFSLFV